MLASYNQDAICATLSTQRSTRSTERKRQFVVFAKLYDFRYFLLAITTDDNLWNLAIETGIRAPPQSAKLISIDTVGSNNLPKFRKELVCHRSS